MRVIVSAAVSADGYLDDCSCERLMLSSCEDWQQVYRLRAQCDAVLVGAGTLRADNPALVIKDEALREARIARGQSPELLRVTLSRSADLDLSLKFFTGPGRPLVFLESGDPGRLRDVADVIAAPDITPDVIIAELERRGVRQLLVEGGQRVLTMFFLAGAVDVLRLAVAPFFVGDSHAPRLVGPGQFPCGKGKRMLLRGTEVLGDMTVMHYDLHPDEHYLQLAIDESRKCTPSATAYCVGAVVATLSGGIYTGYTHQTSPVNHAEEEAIAKALAAGDSLRGATIYSSMEPCSTRASKPESCSLLIIRHGFRRVVFAYREPAHFVDCQGAELLAQHGVEVVEIPSLAPQVAQINRHIQ